MPPCHATTVGRLTALALVGDLKPGDNHPHVDDHDIISLFTTVGDSDMTGGRTIYYNGGSAFNKKDPAGTCGEMIAETPFKHGQYQVGPFETVVHGGEKLNGPDAVVCCHSTSTRASLSTFAPTGRSTTTRRATACIRNYASDVAVGTERNKVFPVHVSSFKNGLL